MKLLTLFLSFALIAIGSGGPSPSKPGDFV